MTVEHKMLSQLFLILRGNLVVTKLLTTNMTSTDLVILSKKRYQENIPTF